MNVICVSFANNWLTENGFSGQIGGEGETSAEDKEAEAEAEAERLEALREAEERRKEKHRKMEEERERMRQGIRDKVSHPFQCFIRMR